ncbi:MAG: insulinase family protein [PVC group bacterium]|nr:insulinase family protein [PVC group bacterium]
MRFKKYFVLLLCSILFTFLACHSKYAHAETIKKYTLENGMVVLIQENPEHKLVALEMIVKTGSIFEGQWQGSGIAHLVEHMLFKGTPTRPITKIEEDLQTLGGSINGYTSHQFTGFPIIVPSGNFDEGLDILQDMIRNPLFDKTELEKEKQVILNEIRLNQDDPQRYLVRTFWNNMYETAPYNLPVIGLEPLFLQLAKEDITLFHEKWYIPNNMILSIAGDVEAAVILDKIKKVFAEFQMQPYPQILVPGTIRFQSEKEHYEELDINVSYLMLGFPSVDINHPDSTSLDIIAGILGQGEGSRLYKKLLKEQSLVYSVNAYNYTPKFPGIFAVQCVLEEENTSSVINALFKEIELLKKKPCPVLELEKTKNIYLSDYLFSRQTIESQAQTAGQDQAYSSDPYFTEKYLTRITAVTSQDVQRCAKKYFNPKNMVKVLLGPKGEPTSPNKAQVTLQGETKKIVLPNGLTLLLKENTSHPTVSMQAIFGGGVRNENETTNGLFNLLSSMLIRGTKRYNAETLTATVEGMGASLAPFSGYNSFGVSLSVLSKHTDAGLDILIDLILNSTFPEKELEIERRLALKGIQIQNDDIFQNTINRLRETLFTQYPYRVTTLGQTGSVENINQKQLTANYKKFCAPNNCVLAIFGDIDTEKIESLIRKKTKNWKKTTIEQVVYPEEPTLKNRKIIENQRDKNQAVVMIGFPGPHLGNNERFGLEFLNHILTASGSILYEQIRETLGLAYTLGGGIVSGLDTGYFYIYIATEPESTDLVISIVEKEIEKLRNSLLDKNLINKNKTDIIGKQRIRLQTNSAISFISALNELYGLGYKHHEKFETVIKSLDQTYLQTIAKKYLNINKSVVVITKKEF